MDCICLLYSLVFSYLIIYSFLLQTACFVDWDDLPDGRPRQTKRGKDIARWIGPTEPKYYSGSIMFDCKVLERSEQLENGLWNYTISAEMQIEDVPHAAIRFVDGYYNSDIHTEGAFRHPIGIPDEICPQPWRNGREEVDDGE